MAPALSGRIVNPRSDGVVYGPDVAQTELPGLVARVGAARAFLVTTPSLERSGLAAEVAGWLGASHAGTFAGSREHTPAPVVIEATEAARAAGADCLVSLGGSSVVDLTKGVALLLGRGREPGRPPDPAGRAPARRCARRRCRTSPCRPRCRAPSSPPWPASPIPSWARSRCTLDRQLLPRWVVFDSVLAASCPARLWAGTGMKVVADTIEVLCARRANPQTDALALGALELLVDNLGPATAAADDHIARGRCQFAVAMVFPQLAAVGVGLVAALRHQLGGGLGIPHGEASTIVLPHVMRFNLPVASEPVRAGRGRARAGDARGADRPHRAAHGRARPAESASSATGIARDDLDGAVVDHVLHDGGSRANIAPVDADGVSRSSPPPGRDQRRTDGPHPVYAASPYPAKIASVRLVVRLGDVLRRRPARRARPTRAARRWRTRRRRCRRGGRPARRSGPARWPSCSRPARRRRPRPTVIGVDTVASGTPRTEYAAAIVWSRAFWL